VAAGILLVTEAGGIVTTIDQDGDPMSGKQIVAGNPEIQAKLRKILREA
jgi:myo-inositol-1(or 4)-monophosphatase